MARRLSAPRQLRRRPPGRRDATAVVDAAALASEVAFLRRAADMQTELIQMVLDGRGIGAIAERLAAWLGNPVAVADPLFHLIVSVPEQPHGDRHRRESIHRGGTPREIIDDPEVGPYFKLAAAQREPVRFPSFPRQGLDQPRLMTAITAGGDVLGFLTVLEAAEPFAPHHAAMLRQAAFILALELLKQRVALETEQRLLSDFLGDLLAGDARSRRALAARAGFLGVDLFRPWLLLLVDADDPAALTAAGGLDDPAAARQRLFDVVRRAIGRFLAGSIAVAQSERIVLLCPAAGGEPPAELARRAAGAVRGAVAHVWPGAGVSVAVGGVCTGPEAFAERYAEAVRALAVVRSLGRRNQTVSLDDLGVYGLLYRREDHGELRRFAERLLAPLLEYDRRRNASLLATLDAYLQEGGAFRPTARRLFIHLNTLRGRLDRVERLTGLDLHDAAARLNLQLALEVHRFAAGAPESGE